MTRGADRLLIHIPHSSTVVPPDVRAGILLNDEELAKEILTIADLYTDELYHLEGVTRVRNEYCRLVFDPERFRNDSDESMAAVGMGAIYTSTVHGRRMRNLSPAEREAMMKRFYDPYHASLERAVDRILEAHGQCLIVDGHSFTSRPLPFERDQSPERPDICVGTDDYHTPESLAQHVEELVGRHGMSEARDFPFAGAITPMKHYRKDAGVRSVMIEVNRKLYMNEETGAKIPGFGRMQAFIRELLESLAGFTGPW